MIIRSIILIFILGFCSLLAQNSEDMEILQALEALDSGDIEAAIESYDKLYSSTKKEEYLREKIALLIQKGEYQNALDAIDEYQKNNPNDAEVKKYLAYIYIQQRDIKKAISTYEELVALKDDFQGNKLLAELYLNINDLKKAKEYALRAYKENDDEKMLLLVVLIDIKNGDFDASFPLIKQHFATNLSEEFSQILIELGSTYSLEDSLKSLYEEYYTKNPNLNNAKNLARFYLFFNQAKKAIELSKKYDLGEDLLIDLYLLQKDYANARIQAQKALDKTHNNHYLGILAIIDFEESNNKKEIAPLVIEKFKKAIESSPNHLFYNYLGYLLIDYDIDIDEGIKYVQLALRFYPNYPAYLDSLAWGYYKKNNCKKAQIEMNKIPQDIIDEENEIKEHSEKINQCFGK